MIRRNPDAAAVAVLLLAAWFGHVAHLNARAGFMAPRVMRILYVAP